MNKLEAHHFVDLEEADSAAGTYHIEVSNHGLPQYFTAHCPCGCKAKLRLTIFPFNGRGEAEWSLSGQHGTHSLFPFVTFNQVNDEEKPHWSGWLLDGAWIKVDSCELKLVNPELNMIDTESPKKGNSGRIRDAASVGPPG